MRNIVRWKVLYAIVVFIVAGGLMAGAVETEAPHHAVEETHHCCLGHHVVDQWPVTTSLPSFAPHKAVCLLTPSLLESQSFIRVTDPPPKFSA
jgi:hypothetical protein